jgi:hypothetical protein
MKTKLFKVSSVLAIAILFFMTIVIGNAFGFGLKSLTGDKKKETVSIDSLVDKQANLVKRLYAAMKDINQAQYHFAQALGDKETADVCMQRGKTLTEGNVMDADSINQHMSATAATAELQNEQFTKASKLDAAKKRELQKGLLPYATGTAHSVLLGKEFANHLVSTKDAIQQAGITGALSVKKKLGITLSVAPNVPKLGSNLFTTANTAIKTAKNANLKIAGAQDALKDIDDV